MKILLLLILLLPIAAAAVVFLVRFPSRKGLLLFTGGALLAETALVTLLACLGDVSMTLFSMTDTLVVNKPTTLHSQTSKVDRFITATLLIIVVLFILLPLVLLPSRLILRTCYHQHAGSKQK